MNHVKYPSEDLIINFPTNDYALLYEMFDSFEKEYYGFNSLVGETQVNFLLHSRVYIQLLYLMSGIRMKN